MAALVSLCAPTPAGGTPVGGNPTGGTLLLEALPLRPVAAIRVIVVIVCLVITCIRDAIAVAVISILILICSIINFIAVVVTGILNLICGIAVFTSISIFHSCNRRRHGDLALVIITGAVITIVVYIIVRSRITAVLIVEVVLIVGRVVNLGAVLPSNSSKEVSSGRPTNHILESACHHISLVRASRMLVLLVSRHGDGQGRSVLASVKVLQATQ
jgi:hypothetical protein